MKGGFLVTPLLSLSVSELGSEKTLQVFVNQWPLVCGTKGPESLDPVPGKIAPCVLPKKKLSPYYKGTCCTGLEQPAQAWGQVSGVLDPQSKPRETQAHGQMRETEGADRLSAPGR